MRAQQRFCWIKRAEETELFEIEYLFNCLN